MTTVRTVAVHDVVAAAFPREEREEDRVAMAIGKAIDGTLSQVGHEARIGRHPTAAAGQRLVAERLQEALDEAGADLGPPARDAVLAELRDVLRQFRSSPLYGLPRPRSRLLLLDGAVGVYAQPDYWDGARRFFEMKSYLAIPPRPDVALQVRLFQLAFPGLEAVLVCIDRHARPVATSTLVVPPPTPGESRDALVLARDVARVSGRDRVLEYIDAPIVRLSVPP
jgi:hypothetical protein